MEISEVERAILENPGAVAVLVNNPTYYGICSDLRSIVKLAHEHEMLVLVDEAHGTHLYFGRIFRSARWMPVRIWRPSPCTNPEEA